jgi:aspartate/methionine/tyrosine aminotransferase
MEISIINNIIAPAKRLQQVEEYYFSKKLAEIEQLRKSGKQIINLGIGSPDLAPSPQTIQALTETAVQSNNHGYQSYRGIAALRNALSSWMKNIYGIELNGEHEILPLMGSKEGIMHISMAFLNPGDEVLIPNPGYPTYSSVSNLVGAKIRTYDLKAENNWEIDLDELAKTDLSKVKIMWLNYPHMPTGKNGSVALFRKLVDFALKHEILLVNDNPYSTILNENPLSIFCIPEAKQVALELNSLSKSHNMAGWRVGWLSGSSSYIDTVLKVKSNMDSGMFLGIQNAAAAALSNPSDWHREQNEVYKTRKQLAEQILDFLGCSYSKEQVGLFVWAKIPDNRKTGEFVDKLLYEAGVFLTPGFIFGTEGEQFIRISLCAAEETFERALQLIKHSQLS